MGLLRSLAAAFSFLTRLPVPGGAAVTERDLGRSVLWFPLVGAALGAALIGAASLLQGRPGHLAAGPTAVVLVALLAALTGGLHLDGLADTFDAWGGGRGDRTRMLEIMRDSRIGAHGAAALCLLLVGKVFALRELLARGALFPIFAAPVFARFAVVPLLILFRYARPAGLGSPFGRETRAGYALAAALLPIGLCVWAGSRAVIPAAAALATALACGWALDRRLGGLTGDVYGAALELAELAFLISAP